VPPAAPLVALILLLAVAAPALAGTPAPGADPWDARVRDAARWAAGREGVVSFAVLDERGGLRGRGVHRPYPSASVFKGLALVAYLDAPGVRGRALRPADRRLLGPMIRRSANAPASRVRDLLGSAAIERRARRMGLRDVQVAPRWGDTRLIAADAARLLRRIDLEVPLRHRAYARRLLAGIVPAQRWGIADARPPGFALRFKGGWRATARGRAVHQAALLERAPQRLGVAVLTDGNPGYGYGTRTVRGVARRLLRGLAP
jgi:hypothetical protein